MAASPECEILEQIKTHHLTCNICHGRYQSPKALPCLHTFCTQCLQDYVYSRRYEPGTQFPCPVCRIPVDLVKGGIEAFPDNHLVVTLMDTVAGDMLEVPNHNVTYTVAEPTIETPPTAAPSTGLYPRLTPVLERRMMEMDIQEPVIQTLDIHTTRRVRVTDSFPQPQPQPRSRSGSSRPRPKPRTTVAAPRATRPAPNPPQTPTSGHEASRSGPVQRTLNLTPEHYPVLIERNRHGALLGIGQYGNGLADFTKPVGLCVSPEGYIIVGDQRENRVFIFEKHGHLKKMFTCQGCIQDLTCNDRGMIYIANTDARKSMVVCYNSRGHTIATFGNFFTYEKPHGIAVMTDNHMAITSTETHQVYILNEYGKMTHKFVGKGKDGKRLQNPYHVATSKKDKIIVADHGNDCVKVFDKHGKFKMQFGKNGSKPGQLIGPMGVCVDRDNNILVCDTGNQRVQTFNSKGQFIRVVMQMTSVDTRVGASPINVAMTPENKLVVLFSGGSYAQVRVYHYTL